MWVAFNFCIIGINDSRLQIAIKAGHEFIVSTDTKYKDICDDKVLWMDYVCIFVPCNG